MMLLALVRCMVAYSDSDSSDLGRCGDEVQRLHHRIAEVERLNAALLAERDVLTAKVAADVSGGEVAGKKPIPYVDPRLRRKLQAGVLTTVKSCDVEAVDLSCTTAASDRPFDIMSPGNHMTVRCPSGCSSEPLGLDATDTTGHVIGGQDGLYLDMSPICLAALHHTERIDGGQYILTIRDAQEEFVASTHNDVTSAAFSAGSWRSFSIEEDPCLGFVNVCGTEGPSSAVRTPRGTIGTGADGGISAYCEFPTSVNLTSFFVVR